MERSRSRQEIRLWAKRAAMKFEDDDDRKPGEERSPTVIVPDGNLDALATKPSRDKASSGSVFKPAIDQTRFDVQRTMAPDGDLDAIELNAESRETNAHTGNPLGPTAPFGSPPAANERETMFRNRGTFVDSGPEGRDIRRPQSASRPVHASNDRPERMGMSGFRFRDGTDDEPSLPSHNFHDGEENAADRPEFTSDASPIPESDRRSDGLQAHPFPATRPRDERHTIFQKASSHARGFRDRLQSASGRNVSPPSDDTAACLDISTDQLEIVIRRIMERVFVDKIETMLKEVLQRAVDREMRSLRETLIKEMKKRGGFPDNYDENNPR